MRVLWPLSVLLAGVLGFAAACGGGDGLPSIEAPGPPVGSALMPDIAPGPPQDARMTHEEGRWLIRFTTFLANVGDGDFVLRATKSERGWQVNQDVLHSESGAKVYPTRATLVWGGDGHDHWHVERIAVGRLVPFEKDGDAPSGDARGRADTKVGFCYFDHSRLADDAPQEVVYPRQACGIETDAAIGMGLSWGWMDIYDSTLPGQSIDVTAVPDGKYRLWVEVDAKRWFQEERLDNNVTWADLEIETMADGSREVRNFQSGPPIDLR